MFTSLSYFFSFNYVAKKVEIYPEVFSQFWLNLQSALLITMNIATVFL